MPTLRNGRHHRRSGLLLDRIPFRQYRPRVGIRTDVWVDVRLCPECP